MTPSVVGIMERKNIGREVKRLEVVRLPYSEIWLGDDGVARTEYYLGTEIVIAEAIEIGAAIIKVCAGIPRPIFTDSRGISRLTRQAREQLASQEISKWTIAVAAHSTPLVKALGTIYTVLNKPSYPIKYFGSRETAFGWLKGFLL